MKKYIYLNNSASSYPKPPAVIRRVEKVLQSPPFHHLRASIENESANLVLGCRKELAALFNAPDPERIVFTSGATESLNLALFGLPFKGKHIVTTAIEHNSTLRPLKTLESIGYITLSIAGCDENGYVPIENIAAAVSPETAAIVVNHCSNVAGVLTDIEAVGKLAKEAGITFVADVSQSAGVYEIDVQKCNIDFLAFTGHKSLYGIPGIGGAYIREGLQVKPLKVGGTNVRSDYLFQPETMPMYYEAGTPNLPGIASLYEGARYIAEKGIENIRVCNERIVARIRQALEETNKALFYPSASYKLPTTLFSFNIKGMEPEDIAYILENNFGIIVRSGLHCAPLIHQYLGTFPRGSVRVSPSHLSDDEDIDAFIAAMNEIVKMAD